MTQPDEPESLHSRWSVGASEQPATPAAVLLCWLWKAGWEVSQAPQVQW